MKLESRARTLREGQPYHSRVPVPAVLYRHIMWAAALPARTSDAMHALQAVQEIVLHPETSLYNADDG